MRSVPVGVSNLDNSFISSPPAPPVTTSPLRTQVSPVRSAPVGSDSLRPASALSVSSEPLVRPGRRPRLSSPLPIINVDPSSLPGSDRLEAFVAAGVEIFESSDVEDDLEEEAVLDSSMGDATDDDDAFVVNDDVIILATSSPEGLPSDF